ncbi:MAG: DUF6352 family protein [Betaproteobacteria bacterium]|nr:DUF6352 family protein [Betaproteobacteria bacterium]MDH3438159.1 DUF6352 family protein [Betaproteobacteria bacterium]
MADFWQSCGYHLLRKSAEGRLLVTDDYVRAYYVRPELAPAPESCDAERALHASLLAEPRRAVAESEIDALADPDAQENFRVMLRFRDQLLAAPTLEGFYAGLFRRDVAVPPDFVAHTAQVILRGILEGTEDGLEARAAELFFRRQRVTVDEGQIMLADDETVDLHATGSAFGDIGRLLREGQVPQRMIELDVLDQNSASDYFRRDERHDTVLNINVERPGCLALCRVLERWIAHFHGASVNVKSVREIPDDEWKWHVGLDAEATAILNEIYNGAEVESERMKRVIGLFRADFRDPVVLRPEVAGFPVFLGLAMAPDGRLRMKPQNLLVNLPLARSA